MRVGSSRALAAHAGTCILVNISQGKGEVEQTYTVGDADSSAVAYDFGALFARRGTALLYGAVHGCVLVWDRASGEIVHGLSVGEGVSRDSVVVHANH